MTRSTRLILLVTVALATTCAHAGIILNSPETWSNTPSLQGWTNATPIGTQNSTLSNPSQYLRITFTNQSGAPVYQDDVIYANGVNYTGNYQDVSGTYGVSFGFYAEDVAPALSEVYLHSSDGDLWEYAFNNAVVGSWVTNSILFDYSTGWVGPGGASQFWNDLTNIDWIGVYVVRKLDTMQQDYGIDNWTDYESVPEPGVLSVLAASLLAYGLALRKKRRHQEALQTNAPASGHG